MAQVLNKYRERALNMRELPGNVVYCGRGSPYGNPFVVGEVCRHDGALIDRDLACDLFDKHVLPTLDVSALRGKDLLCFCKPKRCHCDSILIKANA